MTEIACEITKRVVTVKTTAKGKPKLPKGWKWRGGEAVSPEAWHALYALRAITVPVVSPVIENASPERLKEAWKTLDSQLAEAWQRSTEAANWAVRRLWSNDVTRQANDKKCPKMPEIYLYGERDWTGWSQSASAVLRTVESSYRAKRFEIVWTGSAGVPNVRYPYPYPIHNASWGLEQGAGGEMLFDCRLPAGRVTVRLKTKDKGGKYRMQALQHLAANPGLRGEAAIIKKRDGTITVKLVGWFPKAIRAAEGELRVRTDKESFLVLLNERDERLLILNGDFIRRKMAGHANGLQRWHEDQKFEARIPKRKARKKAEDMKRQCDKMNARIKTFIDEACAHVVGHAVRRKLAAVRYDDTERDYFRDFAWARMRERLAAVCEREGIRFEVSSAETNDATPRKSPTSKKAAT